MREKVSTVRKTITVRGRTDAVRIRLRAKKVFGVLLRIRYEWIHGEHETFGSGAGNVYGFRRAAVERRALGKANLAIWTHRWANRASWANLEGNQSNTKKEGRD